MPWRARELREILALAQAFPLRSPLFSSSRAACRGLPGPLRRDGCGAAVSLGHLLSILGRNTGQFAKTFRLHGFEWAVGVPGSIGGAVRMNAGGHGSDIAACLLRARLFDLRTGDVGWVAAGDLSLAYRSSRVRWSDVDHAGIIYFGSYVRFFEIAETEMYRAMGLPYSEAFDVLDVFPVRAQFHCDFKAPAFLDDLLTCEIWITQIGNSR